LTSIFDRPHGTQLGRIAEKRPDRAIAPQAAADVRVKRRCGHQVSPGRRRSRIGVRLVIQISRNTVSPSPRSRMSNR
jgi:hypothetical protein